ncbi:sigma-70 family RNA polymerase sigma factor [Sphingomonas sp. SORGH_AS_0879]|uniref:sigma-70 family RNA polymerase sigma factor n=1 Tax=Sphingomonas sp. SORGH_AS_0879 TaxID=3041790 RepID=UPI0027824136|nr:sigma-70 family RNA polymerase sigma factor [Sphingomonas sp. SORGH_AS_0879]MDQ1231235.1 RNA polymerase sigma factor (sigma-70 family) [Sphingomonas sp. SORGH_AS_0879]
MSAAEPSVALDGIFRLHHDWLRRWLRPQMTHAHLAEDIAAETMLRLITIAARQTIVEPRAVMTVIARRLMSDLRAKDIVRLQYAAAVAHLPPALEPSAEDRLIILEALRRIERVLRPVSAKARTAFLLSQIDGLRHAEIAERLGISVSMTRKHIAAVMQRCYHEFQDDE